MRFEKWQALGNDYIIVERTELPWGLTARIVRALCDRHTGPGGDGVLEISAPEDSEHVAALRIFNSDGSEAELSGNGAREALLYLRSAGWTDARCYSIKTAAGTITATVSDDDRTCSVAMAPAATTSPDFPGGGADGTGTVAGYGFQHVSVGNPQCAIRVDDETELAALDLAAVGPAIENDAQFPNRTNVSFWCQTGPSRIRVRIFERGVGETRSSGTGSCGAAVAATLAGIPAPITVVLDGGELGVDVGPQLAIDLTGWAVQVYRARLNPDLVGELSG